MRKLAILAGLAGVSITALTTGQALAFPGGMRSVTTGAAPKIQTVQYTHRRPHHYASAPSVRRSPDGALIDSQGWRFWNGQWDNTCFRTLDHLSSSAACSGGGVFGQ
jgi:hypothetical protein